MIWIVIVIGAAAAAALAIWRLEQPLWYRVNGLGALENLLADLVSPLSPWPLMYVDALPHGALVFSRERSGDGFHLTVKLLPASAQGDVAPRVRSKLEAAGFAADQIGTFDQEGGRSLCVAFGLVGPSTLSEAAQAARIILVALGVGDGEVLRARYTGRMDERVVESRLNRLSRDGGWAAKLIARAGLFRTRR